MFHKIKQTQMEDFDFVVTNFCGEIKYSLTNKITHIIAIYNMTRI